MTDACTDPDVSSGVVTTGDGSGGGLVTGGRRVALRRRTTWAGVGAHDSSAGTTSTAHHHAVGQPVDGSVGRPEDWWRRAAGDLALEACGAAPVRRP